MIARIFFFLALGIAGTFLSSECSAMGQNVPAYNDTKEKNTDLYIQPRPVDIVGYEGSAMEPFISPDGQFLFFNTADDSVTKSKTVHYAVRTGLTSFNYLGELPGVNIHVSNTVEAAAPSLDINGHFFFTSTRQFDKDRHSVFIGNFDGKTVSDVHAVEGDINQIDQPGLINMDVSISPDGDTLYLSRTKFNPLMALLFHAPPTESSITIAHRDGAQFMLDPNSEEITKNIKMGTLEYAPAISADGLELYFTSASDTSGLHIMVASRASIDKPFGLPCAIEDLTGFVEAPTLSRDTKELFFHKKMDDRFVIFRAERNPHTSSHPLLCQNH